MVRYSNVRRRKLLPLILLAFPILLARPSLGEEEEVGAKPTQQGPKKSCVTAECHADLQQAKFVHDPIAKNQCDPCHVPVEGAAAYTSGDAHKFKYTGKDGAMCYSAECHKEKEDDEYEEYLHEPIEKRECIVCHDSHKGDDKNLLKAPSDVLCKKCHDVEEEKELYTGKHIHDPVAKGRCDVCHYSHESPYEALTRAEGSKGCFTGCHDHDDEKALYWGKKVLHKPLKENCNYCHNPHTGDDQRLLKFPTQRELCFDCHKDIKKVLKVGACRHKTIDEKQECLNCHASHSSDHWKILKERFPEGFYPTFRNDTYNLCFECHERALATTEFTTTRTKFRDGNINLHFIHVKGQKGHTCRICHGSHAAKHAKLVNESFSFGKDASVPLNYETAEDGGRCSPTCHVSKAYDRRDILQKLVSVFDSFSRIDKKREGTPDEESANEGGKRK